MRACTAGPTPSLGRSTPSTTHRSPMPDTQSLATLQCGYLPPFRIQRALPPAASVFRALPCVRLPLTPRAPSVFTVAKLPCNQSSRVDFQMTLIGVEFLTAAAGLVSGARVGHSVLGLPGVDPH